MSLNGKVVIITGGTRGIGKGIALEFAKEGAILVLTYLNDDDSAYNTVEEIKKMGNHCTLARGDVSNYNFSKKLIEDTIKNLGKVDVLINNAGISKVGLFMDTKEEEFDELISVNLKSVFNTASAVVKHMISRKEGIIINISSIWGNEGASCEVLYSASKGAINSFTKALAKELAPSNIRVNAIAPGVIDTKMNQWMDENERGELNSEIPMGRFGSVSEVGRTAVFLASGDSSYITGEILNVNGGF